MHNIIDHLMPILNKTYQPIYYITVNIQNIYDLDPQSTLSILGDFSLFKKEFKNILIKRLEEQEGRLKQYNKYIKDYYLIKNHRNLLSIFKYTEIVFEIVNIPYFLYYKSIKSFHGQFFAEHKYILNNKTTHSLRTNNRIISTKGILSLDKVEEILRSKLFVCINDMCEKKSIFLLIFKNKKPTVYFVKDNHYYLEIDFNNKCRICKTRLIEEIKHREIEYKYFYFLHDGVITFRCYSLNKLQGNIHIGTLIRNDETQNLNFEIISSSNTSLITQDFIEGKTRILSNFEYFENTFETFIQKYFRLHLCFLEDISDIEISLIVILHLYLLFDCSIAIFTNDYYFIRNISKHFFNIYSLDIPILFEPEKKKGLYIFYLNSHFLKNNGEEVIDNIDFSFKIEVTEILDKFESSFQKKEQELEFVVFYTEFDFKNDFKYLIRSFFNIETSSDKLIRTLVSIRLALKNICRGQFYNKIDVFIRKLFFSIIV